MRKKKKQIQIGNTYLNRKNQQCKVLGRDKGKSKGLFIVAVLDQPSEVEKDGCFHYAASPDELTLPRSPKQIINNIKEDLEQLCKQAKQQREKVELQLHNLKKCKEVIKPKYGTYRLNPKRFGQIAPGNVSKEFRKAAREIGRQVSIQFGNLKIGRAAARNTTSEVLDMADRVIRSLIVMEAALEGLPRQVADMIYTGKLYNYERRREIELYNKTLGKDLTLSQKPAKDRGQKKGAKIMASKKSDKEKVQSLLRKLEKATEQQEKREIRAELRSLGHQGGLGKGAGRPKKKASKKVSKKKKKAKEKSAAA